MEYVKGRTLKEKICKGGVNSPLEIIEILDIAAQLLEALAKAHQAGIIHRDIKPQNILIDSDARVKILDFGLAKLKGISQITKKSSTLGTAHYISPEQIQGENVCHCTDIWSLGVVFYEMVTGQLPFNGEYEQSVLYSIMNEEPEPLTALRTGAPMELEHIVNKSLAKDQSQRYQSTDDITVDLKAFIKKIESGESKELSPGTEAKPAIAVLPFEDMSPGKDQEYFCDGMAEELIDAFTKTGRLQVVSRTSAFQFKGKGVDIHEIGKKLNVQTVLEGSVRKAGNRLRITAQLVKVADGYHLWSEKYDRDMDDIFAIQDEISLAIVENLKVKLLGDEKAEMIKRYTRDKEAYNLYLQGRYFWNRRHEGGMNKAVEYFQQAIEKDPLYALPYVGIADAFNILGFYGFIPPMKAFPKAKAAANKALEIDNTLGEAYASLGWISTMFDWDWTSAEREFKKSIALNPNYATAHEWYALYLAAMGRLDEAISEAKKAQALDPLSLIINVVVGLVFYGARRYDKAISQLQKTLEMDPDFQIALWLLGLTYVSLARYEDATASFQKAMQLPGGIVYSAGYLGMSYALSGQKEKALKMLNQIDELLEKGYSILLHKVALYIGLGEMDQAFEFLGKACMEKESHLTFLKIHPVFDPLRGDPRFNDLLKKIGWEQ
jgi:serine/threonine-protein kinase